jgi:mono/diheme cytochrome c family protein
MIAPIASRFAATASPADKKAVVDALASRTDEFSKTLLANLAKASPEIKPMVRKHTPDPAVHRRGLEVYNRTCIACHGPEGKGVPLAFPPLDGSSRLVGNPTLPIRIVIHGLQGPIEASGQKFNNIMAPLGDLKDQEIADVLTYVRQSWSNDQPPVQAETVKQVRAANADRKTPLTAEDLK